MGMYWAARSPVERLIERAGSLTLDEAVDIYRAHAARWLIQGSGAERQALIQARRAATRSRLAVNTSVLGMQPRQHGGTASPTPRAPGWRWELRSPMQPARWSSRTYSTTSPYDLLIGPWQQAIGTMTPVGPGIPEHSTRARAR